MFVADCLNNTVRLFNSSLSHLGDVIINDVHKLYGPQCLHLDETSGRLYVGEKWKEPSVGGRVFVFSAASYK